MIRGETVTLLYLGAVLCWPLVIPLAMRSSRAAARGRVGIEGRHGRRVTVFCTGGCRTHRTVQPSALTVQPGATAKSWQGVGDCWDCFGAVVTKPMRRREADHLLREGARDGDAEWARLSGLLFDQ